MMPSSRHRYSIPSSQWIKASVYAAKYLPSVHDLRSAIEVVLRMSSLDRPCFLACSGTRAREDSGPTTTTISVTIFAAWPL